MTIIRVLSYRRSRRLWGPSSPLILLSEMMFIDSIYIGRDAKRRRSRDVQMETVKGCK